jgi:hypothetical protein
MLKTVKCWQFWVLLFSFFVFFLPAPDANAKSMLGWLSHPVKSYQKSQLKRKIEQASKAEVASRQHAEELRASSKEHKIKAQESRKKLKAAAQSNEHWVVGAMARQDMVHHRRAALSDRKWASSAEAAASGHAARKEELQQKLDALRKSP